MKIFYFITFIIYLFFYFFIYYKTIYFFVNYQNFDVKIIDEIKNELDNKIEMDYIEQKFLNGIIRYYKPKKILEIGVSRGGSSSLILNAIKDIKESFLFSIDSNEKFYKKNLFKKEINKTTGYLVNEKFPNLSKKWKLFLGNITAAFINDIGKDIDLVFLDTVHLLPGEFLDFLQFLPFLKTNAIIVIHDIIFHSYTNYDLTSNNLLFSIIKGKKILPFNNNSKLANIGAVILEKNQNQFLFDYFFALNSHWFYLPNKNEINIIYNFFKKFYNNYYIELFKEAYNMNVKMLIHKKQLKENNKQIFNFNNI